ncbi:MAG TPA: YihY/virulence factor BrkB family protein [Candidatus Acidoferrales bacterium]|nr:YihY/virulence factor BrkB family protein [Candidatus Acidoferrales bacterium]
MTAPSGRDPRAWLARVAARVLGIPAVVGIRAVLNRYNSVGGGLLAGGLAYSALFAIVPAMLLTAGLAGLAAGDPAERAHVVATIAGVFPPLRDLVDVILAEADRNVGPLGVVGAATLLWGASRFVLSFDDAISRVLGRTARRAVVIRNLAAVAAVVLLAGTIILGPIVAGLASFLDAAESEGVLAVVGGAVRLALGFVPPIATVGAIALVFRIVPLPMPRWRSVTSPALVAGIVLTGLLQGFVFLAPRLVGTAALLGTIAAVFVALAWLSLSFQVILVCAAWVGERDARFDAEALAAQAEAESGAKR